MLVGRGIEKTFGAKQVLRGVDVSVAPGQITALIGPSGSGKSTLLRGLSLLDPAHRGWGVWPCLSRGGIFPPSAAGGEGKRPRSCVLFLFSPRRTGVASASTRGT